MITWDMIYWITRLDGIIVFFTVLTVLIGVVTIVFGIIRGVYISEEAYEEYRKEVWRNYFKIMILPTMSVVIFSTILIFIPTTKQAIAMKVLPAISNNKVIKDILPKELSEYSVLIKESLKKYIKED